MYLLICLIYFELRWNKKLSSHTQFPIQILHFKVTVKTRPSADYIGIKISVLPPTQQFFKFIELPIPQRILQISVQS